MIAMVASTALSKENVGIGDKKIVLRLSVYVHMTVCRFLTTVSLFRD